MQVITNAAFDAARAAYTLFTIKAAARLAKEVGFSYEALPHAPGSDMAHIDRDIQSAYHASMTHHCAFPVWDGACDNTVFTNREGNYAFRFWHDVVSHCSHGLGFDTDSELKAGMQWVERVAGEFGAQSVEAMIAYADTCGQTLFCQQTGEFPADQLAFVTHYLNVGDDHGTLKALELQSMRAAAVKSSPTLAQLKADGWLDARMEC